MNQQNYFLWIPNAYLKFTDHRRRLLQNRYVYAVKPRRAKWLSIGMNLNADPSVLPLTFSQLESIQPALLSALSEDTWIRVTVST